MLSIPYEKHCSKCDLVKPLTEFYPRGQGTKYYSSYCKECMKLDSKNQVHVDPKVSSIPSENDVITELAKMGIPAFPGKAFNHHLADIVAWGCVLIETKSSAMHENGGFEFAFTHRQQKREIRGSLIVLVCRYNDHNTYHVFQANDPKFYRKNGTLKTTVSFKPKRSKSGPPSVFTEDIMAAHKDAWHMLEADKQRVIQELKQGRELIEVLKAA